MTEIYGGKMAFPIHNTGHGAPFDEGMTLRDYFAAKAMQGMLAGQDRRLVATKEFIGETAYEYADSMLKYRDSGE
jgi:hypothetical protein